MTSEPIRDPEKDHLLTPRNAVLVFIDYQPPQVQAVTSMERYEMVDNVVGAAKAALLYGVPIIHSTVNVATGMNQPPIPQLGRVLESQATYDRTTINAWEDVEFRRAVEEIGRKKLVMMALWTEACLTFPALDALREGYEVYIVADAVGGSSPTAHEMALRRIQQAGGTLISKIQLYAELQRDWARKDTLPGYVDLYVEHGGNAGLSFAMGVS